jgi:hypothetical protein
MKRITLRLALKTVFNWMQNPEFAAEVDRLSLMVGVASRVSVCVWPCVS